MSSSPPPAKRQRVDDAEQDEAINSILLDFACLTQEVDLEASTERSDMTHIGKCVMIGHLTQDHMQRAMFLGLSSCPAKRTKWVKKELRKHCRGASRNILPIKCTTISIKVNHDENMYFQMSSTNSSTKLFRTWCNLQNQDLSKARFFYNDRRLRATDTPDAVGMKEGDTVEVRTAQDGNFLV